MKKELIKERGMIGGLEGQELNVFIEFFSTRFPDESDNITSYVDEWVNRFKSGNPSKWMDMQSSDIYFDIISR